LDVVCGNAGSEVRTADTDVKKLFLDGSETVFTLPAEEKLKLTRSFEPLVLAQNAGLFANPPGTDLVTLKAKWASLDYLLMVRRVPRIADYWQVQNGIILTAGFDLLK
jgi:hypothetical protein